MRILTEIEDLPRTNVPIWVLILMTIGFVLELPDLLEVVRAWVR